MIVSRKMLLKSKGVTIFYIFKKNHNKEVNVQGAPSSVIIRWSTEIIPYSGSTLVVYIVHRFSFSHTYTHAGLVTL